MCPRRVAASSALLVALAGCHAVFGLDELVDAAVPPGDGSGPDGPASWGCAPVSVPIGGVTSGVAVARFDDRGLDLVATKPTSSKLAIVGVLPGREFATVIDRPSPGAPTALAVGDLDGNQLSDVVTANGSTGLVYLGDGSTVADPATLSLGNPAVGVAIGPYNDDAASDVMFAVRQDDLVVAYLNDAGSFANSEMRTVPAPLAVGVGQFDAGPALDVVALGYGTNGTDGAIVAFEATDLFSPVIGPRVMAIGDVVDSTVSDVVVGTDAGDVVVYAGNGTNQFLERARYPFGQEIIALAVGRVDDDAQTDIVVVTPDTVSLVRLFNGDTQRETLGTVMGASGVQLADLDGDGATDLVVSSLARDALTVFWCR